MRLVTVNLYSGRVDVADLGRFLEKFRPEVLAAQEVGIEAGALLVDRFPHGMVEHRSDTAGRALVATMPIEVSRLPLPSRGGYRGQTRLGGEPVEILGVHLRNPVDWPPTLAARRGQLAGLEPWLARPGRRVLVGDLNSTPVWPGYRSLTRHLDDAVAGWARRNHRRPAATWAPRPGWPALLRIDHVLTQGIRVDRAWVERVSGLDHRAVVVDLSLA